VGNFFELDELNDVSFRNLAEVIPQQTFISIQSNHVLEIVVTKTNYDNSAW
jgi:hypothetical protein